MERELDAISWVLDETFRIPGTRRRFGLESLIGVVPVVGDVAGAGLGLYLIGRALRLRIPGVVVLRMVLNTGLDFVIGLVPVLGDAFDFVYKSNTRNVRLLRQYATDPTAPTRQHVTFLVGMALVLVGVLWLTFLAAGWVLSSIEDALRGILGQ